MNIVRLLFLAVFALAAVPAQRGQPPSEQFLIPLGVPL